MRATQAFTDHEDDAEGEVMAMAAARTQEGNNDRGHELESSRAHYA